MQRANDTSFESLHQTVAEEFHAGHYGRSLAAARRMTALIQRHRQDAVLASMPDPPEGYEVVPEKRPRLVPGVASVNAAFGQVIQRRYRARDGRGELEVTVTADSPLIQMFQTWVTNPALLGVDGELIRYEEHHAVLRTEGPAHSLQIPIGNALLEARVRGRRRRVPVEAVESGGGDGPRPGDPELTMSCKDLVRLTCTMALPLIPR